MGWYSKFYGTPGPGIPKDAHKPTGLRLFFSTLAREWKNLLKLNLMFLLFSLPVVTIPAALCAMQHITIKMIQDEPFLLWADFRAAFRRLWKRASLWGWGYTLLMLAAVYCLHFYAQLEMYHTLFLLPFLFAAILTLFLALSGIYLFPLLIRSDMSGRALIQNACLMALAYLPHGLPALICSTALGLLCDIFFPLAWPIVLLFLFALQSLLFAFSAWSDICRQLRRSNGAVTMEFDSNQQ